MTSLFSVEDVKFDPAQKVGFTNFSSNFVEETVQGLLGKGMFGGQKTSEMARQQARQGAFMRRLSEMDISDFQEVPQDDGDVWLVAATTVDGEVHHVHISENSIYDSFKLVEATPEEVEARKKHKFKFSKNLDGTDGALTEIDGKRYFVDMHILFNFGVNGTAKACTTFAMSLAGGFLVLCFCKRY
ncbi:hypothetical protein [Pseudomonas asplenii]|uniref:hypothetical protein n=1 Tax=Pseudomonas asplenii TaxID=53407 RepID=UPI00128ECC91|nr:hypothetical protein [Pseudomonas fuscovaginae]